MADIGTQKKKKNSSHAIPDFRKNPYFLVVYIGIIFFESSFPSWHCV